MTLPHRKESFSFKRCMAMMRNRDPQTFEYGFFWLQPHASEFVHELIAEFAKTNDDGLRCPLLELIGNAKSTEAFGFLSEQIHSDNDRLRYWAIRGLRNLNTKEARTLLWEARSFTFGATEDTAEFLADLDENSSHPEWFK